MSLKRSRRLSLAFSLRLSLLYAAFFVVSILGLFFSAYYLAGELVQDGEEEVIQARVQEYRAWYAEGGLGALKTRFEEQTRTRPGRFFLRLISPRGEVLLYSLPGGQGPSDLEKLRIEGDLSEGVWFILEDQKRGDIWTVGSLPLGPGLVLQVGKHSGQSLDILHKLRAVFFWFAAPVLILGLAGGMWMTYRALAPVRRVTETVSSILSTGELSRRVPVHDNSSELQELVSLFNRMLKKNQALIDGMHDSLDNVAHDLKTPMTRLRAVAEMALSDPQGPGAYEEALADCLEESDRVLAMLHALMDVAEAEAGAMKLEMEPVSVSELFDSVTDLYEIVAEDKGVVLNSAAPEDLTVPADRSRLGQALANLVDNAIKYSDAGGEVEIKAWDDGKRVFISVQDRGMGIPAGDLDKIWDRLFRGDASRSRRGLGLGLSFVKAIVEAHGGEVKVQTHAGEGSLFTIGLPG